MQLPYQLAPLSQERQDTQATHRPARLGNTDGNRSNRARHSKKEQEGRGNKEKTQ